MASAARWTATDHATYAAQVDARMDRLRADLTTHQQLDAHPAISSRVDAVQRQIDRLEAAVEKLGRGR